MPKAEIEQLTRLITRFSLLSSATESKKFLHEHPDLLLPLTEAIFHDLLVALQTPNILDQLFNASGKTHQDRLNRCRNLLNRAKKVGIDKACEEVNF